MLLRGGTGRHGRGASAERKSLPRGATRASLRVSISAWRGDARGKEELSRGVLVGREDKRDENNRGIHSRSKRSRLCKHGILSMMRYPCTKCERKFARKSNRDRHQDSIHGDNPVGWLCPYRCTYTSTRKWGMLRHIRTTHGKAGGAEHPWSLKPESMPPSHPITLARHMPTSSVEPSPVKSGKDGKPCTPVEETESESDGSSAPSPRNAETGRPGALRGARGRDDRLCQQRVRGAARGHRVSRPRRECTRGAGGGKGAH